MTIDQDSQPTGELDAEILQEDPPYKAGVCVPVVVEGPVAIQQVPSVASGSFSRDLLVADVNGQRLLGADPRRRIARILCADDFYVASEQASVAHGSAARWGSFIPCEITHREEVWVRAAVGNTTISVMVENWAD